MVRDLAAILFSVIFVFSAGEKFSSVVGADNNDPGLSINAIMEDGQWLLGILAYSYSSQKQIEQVQIYIDGRLIDEGLPICTGSNSLPSGILRSFSGCYYQQGYILHSLGDHHAIVRARTATGEWYEIDLRHRVAPWVDLSDVCRTYGQVILTFRLNYFDKPPTLPFTAATINGLSVLTSTENLPSGMLESRIFITTGEYLRWAGRQPRFIFTNDSPVSPLAARRQLPRVEEIEACY